MGDSSNSQSSASAAEAQDDLPIGIQDALNFLLLRPASLPKGWVATGSLRKERAPDTSNPTAHWTNANPSSYRFQFTNGETTFRLKQFLYDWGIAAGDLPCLWGSPTRPFEINENYVGWHGVDFQGRQGAFARIARTCCEVSIVAGTMSEDVIETFFRSLEIYTPEAAANITRTPMAQLSYWARYNAEPVNAPMGFIRWRRDRRPIRSRWICGNDLDREKYAVHLPEDAGFNLDTIQVNEFKSYNEYEFLFVNGPDHGHELRVIFFDQIAQYNRFTPWKMEKHPATIEIDLDRQALIAHASDQYGSYNAVLHNNGCCLFVTTSARVGWNIEWFRSLLQGISLKQRGT